MDTESVSHDHEHNKRVTHGKAYRPIQGVRIDQTFYNPQQHEAEYRQKLTSLKVGQRIVSDMDGVRLETVEMLPEPWPLGLTKIRTEKAISRIRSREYYRSWPINTGTIRSQWNSSKPPANLPNKELISQPQSTPEPEDTIEPDGSGISWS